MNRFNLIEFAARIELISTEFDALLAFAKSSKRTVSIDKQSLHHHCERINSMMEDIDFGAVLGPLDDDSTSGLDDDLPIRRSEILSIQEREYGTFSLEFFPPSGSPLTDFIAPHSQAGDSGCNGVNDLFDLISEGVASWKQYLKYVPLAASLLKGTSIDFLPTRDVARMLGKKTPFVKQLASEESVNCLVSEQKKAVKANPAQTFPNDGERMICLTPVLGLGKDDIFGDPVGNRNPVDFYDPVKVAQFFHEYPILFA